MKFVFITLMSLSSLSFAAQEQFNCSFSVFSPTFKSQHITIFSDLSKDSGYALIEERNKLGIATKRNITPASVNFEKAFPHNFFVKIDDQTTLEGDLSLNDFKHIGQLNGKGILNLKGNDIIMDCRKRDE